MVGQNTALRRSKLDKTYCATCTRKANNEARNSDLMDISIPCKITIFVLRYEMKVKCDHPSKFFSGFFFPIA